MTHFHSPSSLAVALSFSCMPASEVGSRSGERPGEMLGSGHPNKYPDYGCNALVSLCEAGTTA